MEIRYVACDLRTGEELLDPPLQGVTFADEINAPGELRAAVNMAALGAVKRRSVRDSLIEGRTALYVLADDNPLWAGIVWDLEPSSDGNLVVAAEGFLSYFAQRLITADAAFVGVDQFTIARSLVDTAQAKPGGNIRVTTEAATCGVPRDRTYLGYELKPVLEALQQLCAVDNGFDMSIDVFRDPTTSALSQRLALWYPHRGRDAADTGVALSFPGNIRSYRWGRTAHDMATDMYSIGQGDGESRPLSATAQTVALINAGWPVLDAATSYTDVSVQSTLDDHARADAARRAGPRVTPTITLRADDPPIAEYAVGDHVRVRIDDPCHPPPASNGAMGLDTSGRIVRRQVTIPDSGLPTVELTLNPGLVGPGAIELAGVS